MWNFKGYLWNSTQNICPIHWKMWILFTGENLRFLRFKSSYVFLKRPLVCCQRKMNQDSSIFLHENVAQNIVCKMTASLYRPKWAEICLNASSPVRAHECLVCQKWQCFFWSTWVNKIQTKYHFPKELLEDSIHQSSNKKKFWQNKNLQGYKSYGEQAWHRWDGDNNGEWRFFGVSQFQNRPRVSHNMY